MTYLKSWEEFEKAAEKLYLQDPSKIRYSMKYVHSKNVIILKVTDDIMCVQFRTEIQQDLRKIEKFVNNLMRHMVSKDH